MSPQDSQLELTILMPCLDEAETLATCIGKARSYIESSGIAAEVLVADNGSTDGSVEIALENGARVEHVPQKGYGSALIAGIAAAKGRYVIMADADDSYDFLHLEPFVEQLRQGHDLVMGNRFRGGIADNAMPPLHRYLGNPVLSFIGKLFFSIKVGDFHCGLRGFNRARILELNLVCTGMEFASEMVVKAALNGLSIVEVPTTLSQDGRSRPPHLRSWRDGWRHLRFLLIFSPSWLFLYPGIFALAGGLIAMALLMSGPVTVGSVTFDIHTLMFAGAAVVIGLQLVGFSLLGRVLGTKLRLLPDDGFMEKIERFFSIEKGLIIGGLMAVIGLAYAIYAIMIWQQAEFGALNPGDVTRKVVPAITLVICGVQVFFSAFFAGMMESFFVSSRRS